ncbi:hypothetical protein OG508_28065 [Streptomyces sp. NBC_01108]|uniref:hypothetical protein n=1 Tax=Streptomyces sp. NBC_01108 TaxID=2903751 RepID=UPI003872C992|nr:hypothetical protein OG508_28065 [Streptomyces sp. NBC_01108]
MTTIVILERPHTEVIHGLGPLFWPIRSDATTLRIDPTFAVTDGAVIIYPTPGMPGTWWWLIDGVIPPQAAGRITADFAAQVPGSVLILPPPPEPDEPPLDHP